MIVPFNVQSKPRQGNQKRKDYKNTEIILNFLQLKF